MRAIGTRDAEFAMTASAVLSVTMSGCSPGSHTHTEPDCVRLLRHPRTAFQTGRNKKRMTRAAIERDRTLLLHHRRDGFDVRCPVAASPRDIRWRSTAHASAQTGIPRRTT
eukprot:3804152-Rhodomonas_salina.2